MAELLPFGPRVADEAPAFDNSPSRARLREAIAALDAAQKDLTGNAQPKSRFEEIISRAAALETELATCQAADERALGSWLAGSFGPRPQPTTGPVATELAEIMADRRAASAAMPAAEQQHMAAVQRVRAAGAERDRALCEACVAAAEEVAGELVKHNRRIVCSTAASGRCAGRRGAGAAR